MAGLTAEQIYDYFYNQATGTGPLTTAQSDLRQLASNYLDRAAATQRSLDKIRACWQGDASDLASQGLVPIAEALLAHGEALTTAQDGVSQQVDAWHQTRNAIQQVPPQPVPQDLVKAAGNGTLSGGALIPQGVTLMNQVKAYDAVSQANVDAYNTYSGTTDNNTGRMPPLNPLQPNTSAPLTVAAASPATPSTEHASSGSVATGHTKRSTTSQTSPAAAPAAGPAPAAPSPAAPPTVDITTTSGATAPSASAVTSPGSTSTAGVGPADDLPPYVPGSISNILSGDAAEPTFSGNPSPKPGSGAGSAGSAGNAGTGGGPRSGARAVNEPTPAARRVEAVAGEKAGTAAAPGMVGGPGAGKDEDTEHKRKYKYGPGPEEYQDKETVAPDVIGESEAHRRARIEAAELGETRLDKEK
ncbi:MAG TPA: hypothetical protein VF444_11385 [Pseudonocardiaceae bacterium]